MGKDEARFTIGEVARASGLTRKALMVLEEDGAIVPERGANGYRLYSERQLRQAWIAKRLRAAGYRPPKCVA
jgi:DNA-binding transcriptional MerR regulator